MSDPAGIPALIDAIRHLHDVGAKHVATERVVETHDGKIVWAGDIEIFDLIGHAKAKRCYAWSEATKGDKRRFFAVLHGAPVESAQAALQASFLADQIGA